MHVRLLCTVTWNGLEELNELHVYNVIRTLHITTHLDQIITKGSNFFFLLANTLSKSSYKSRPNVANMGL